MLQDWAVLLLVALESVLPAEFLGAVHALHTALTEVHGGDVSPVSDRAAALCIAAAGLVVPLAAGTTAGLPGDALGWHVRLVVLLEVPFDTWSAEIIENYATVAPAADCPWRGWY